MIEYRKATLRDMHSIAQLHQGIFPDYFLTSLGTDLIEKYYTEYLKTDDLFVVALDSESSKYDGFIGLCMGYYTGSKARQNFESKYKFKMAKKLLLRCICFDKKAIKKCINKIFSKFHKKSVGSSNVHPDADLLSIGVLENYRGKSVASGLLKAFEDVMKCGGGGTTVKSCILSVFEDNLGARKFYEKNGFILLEKYPEGLKYIKYFK